MAATLYRLVGREHHAVSVELKPQESVVEVSESLLEHKLDAADENQINVINHDVVATLSETPIIDQPVVQVDEAESVVEMITPPKQIWDSSMSRTQLAKIASSLSLVFTDKSTKSEILALLESASKV